MQTIECFAGDELRIVLHGPVSLLIEAAPNAAPAPERWAFPVNDPGPEAWYCAVWHDLTGARNDGYRHTGIDLNLDRRPWGDVERGYPVYAVQAGTVTAVDYSAGWLGVVQVQSEEQGKPLWWRYAHLDRSKTPAQIEPGAQVQAGDVLGYIGNWTGGDGGDHLHLDAARRAFRWNEWRTSGGWVDPTKWLDPLEILYRHLDEDLVQRMLRRNDG
jgi:murein DD-endopeptidase MepM/ murein hydrolase activator NlpD